MRRFRIKVVPGRSSDRGRLALRSRPRHHHLPRSLARSLTDSHTPSQPDRRVAAEAAAAVDRRRGHGPRTAAPRMATARAAQPASRDAVGRRARVGAVRSRAASRSARSSPSRRCSTRSNSAASSRRRRCRAPCCRTRSRAATSSAARKPARARPRRTCCPCCRASFARTARPVRASRITATRALILAPTRELATQIDDEIQGFAYHAPVASAAVYGGVPMGPQERALKAGVDIVVATPGRLLDHMRSNVGDYSTLEIFVLDEADRMMDMGFWPDVRKIAEALPPTSARQTMLFSATMPEEVMRFADALAPTSVFVQVGSRRGPAKTITHEARILPVAREGDVPREVPAAAPRAGDRVRQHEDWMRSSGAATGVDRPARRGGARGSIAAGSDGDDRELPHRPTSGCSSPPTSPRAASTSKTCRSSSTTKSRAASIPTSTASAAPAATSPRATRSRSPIRPNAASSSSSRRRSD